MAQINPQLAPIITPPQLPYEVFQAKANADVMPEIAALNMLGEVLGEKLPKAIKEQRRTQRLAEVFKSIDSDDLMPDSAKQTAKEALIVGGEDAPLKVMEARLKLKDDSDQIKFLRDKMNHDYSKDFYTAKFGERVAKIPSHIWDDLMLPRTKEELLGTGDKPGGYFSNLSQAVKPYGIKVTGIGRVQDASWWNKRTKGVFGQEPLFVPSIVIDELNDVKNSPAPQTIEPDPLEELRRIWQ